MRRKHRLRPSRRWFAASFAVAFAGLAVIAVVFAASWPFGRAAHVRGLGDGGASTSASPGQPGLDPSADPSASAGPPSVSPSRPKTSPTTRPPAPRAGGKPGPGNTGVPAGTRLTLVNGDQTFATSNQVVSGMDIHGFVRITGKNVTIKNSIIRGGSRSGCSDTGVLRIDNGGSATVQDTEISPSAPNACLDGIWASNATLVRMNIHGSVDGIKAGNNLTLQDSWVHDLSWFASDPNQGGGETHNDDVQTLGNQHITLRHNTMSAGTRGNAAYQVTQDNGTPSTDLHIDGNWIDGGGCMLNFAHKGGPTPMTGIFVTNNRFGRGSAFQCPILISTQTRLSQNAGNVWDDTGKAIPSPQQHD
jgi:hypothetical protein